MSDEKRWSSRALDLLNFCNAGIQTGLGPFIAIFYAGVRHWNPGQVGVALACQSSAGILIQPAVGRWIDDSYHKRFIAAVAAFIVAACALAIAFVSSYALQIVTQLIIGVAVTVFPAAIAAFALGLVGQSEIASRVARNESFAHSGNFVFAAIAAAVGSFYSLQAIFYAAATFACGMGVAAVLIRNGHLSHDAARAAEIPDGDETFEPTGIRTLLKDKRVLTFSAAIVLFYCANAATLPLVGQILSAGHNAAGSAWQISAAVMVAEGVMIGVSAYSGRLSDRFGRKPLFLIAFAALALRNALTVVNHNRYYLIGLQAFDGVAAAIYGVLLTLVSADLARGTGRFNFLRSAVQSAMGLGGFVSNAAFGLVAKSLGFNAAFWGLAAVATSGGLLYQAKMPETRARAEHDRPQQTPAATPA